TEAFHRANMAAAGSWLLLWLFFLKLQEGSFSQNELFKCVCSVQNLLVLTLSSQPEANSSHIGRVCTTWGHHHFKTFDGEFFQLPSSCNHILASQCGGSYESFIIQMRRRVVGGATTISNIVMKLEGSVVELSNNSVVVDGETVSLPHISFGVTVRRSSSSIFIEAKLGVTAVWNLDDSLDIELDQKYQNQICGLCGNFDGIANDFTRDGEFPRRSAFAMWSSSCFLADSGTCFRSDQPLCEQIFSSAAFSSCQNLLDVDSFVKACASDMCTSNTSEPLVCMTVSEFSRQCVHADGRPLAWRNEMQQSPETPLLREGKADHCAPSGTVWDDIRDSGCIPVAECPCVHDGNVYQSGESYTLGCRSCGHWTCSEENCPGTCSVEGGAHINTFDGKVFTFHGDCSYVLAKVCVVEPVGQRRYASLLPLSNIRKKRRHIGKAQLSIFRPSSFYIFISTDVGISVTVQLSPLMQVFISADTSIRGGTSGLCGNFNNVMSDDFRVSSGLVEGSAVAFANSWKTRASCPDVSARFGPPCSQDFKSYAQFWCSKLSDPEGVFVACHSVISPAVYKENCMYDTCTCEKSEDCMCAAVSSYVYACSAAGVHIKPLTPLCSLTGTSCGRTCRSLSQVDYSCRARFAAVDGCGCADGTYLNEAGQCVSISSCSCYDEDTIIPAGQAVSRDGSTCVCRNGALSSPTSCVAPMVYFDCSTAPPGATGAECQRSCSTADMACVSPSCTSGCVCPDGLLSDGAGGCVNETSCPCVYNGQVYQPGQTLTVDCNTCSCAGRKFTCTNNECDAVCGIYGEGHYVTFDEKRFDFSGQCEYTLAQGNGSFTIVTENIPCGTTGTTCSKTIKIYLEVKTSKMGIYLVVTIKPGLVLMWDQKTSLFITLSPRFQGQVCGLCGNYDGNSKNDFTTRSQEMVADVLQFGNSWKVSSSCPNAQLLSDPCTSNRYRAAWSQKQCSIITSSTFQICHSKVPRSPESLPLLR
uniref:VWFD domain-containing protein n=1 Tax=Oryzias melastigma TaxID=30732 RepID=A0A3B3DYL4_ORYME